MKNTLSTMRRWWWLQWEQRGRKKGGKQVGVGEMWVAYAKMNYSRVNFRRVTVGGYVRIREEERSASRYLLYYNSLFPRCHFTHTYQLWPFLSRRDYRIVSPRWIGWLEEDQNMGELSSWKILLCGLRCSRYEYQESWMKWWIDLGHS